MAGYGQMTAAHDQHSGVNWAAVAGYTAAASVGLGMIRSGSRRAGSKWREHDMANRARQWSGMYGRNKRGPSGQSFNQMGMDAMAEWGMGKAPGSKVRKAARGNKEYGRAVRATEAARLGTGRNPKRPGGFPAQTRKLKAAAAAAQQNLAMAEKVAAGNTQSAIAGRMFPDQKQGAKPNFRMVGGDTPDAGVAEKFSTGWGPTKDQRLEGRNQRIARLRGDVSGTADDLADHEAMGKGLGMKKREAAYQKAKTAQRDVLSGIQERAGIKNMQNEKGMWADARRGGASALGWLGAFDRAGPAQGRGGWNRVAAVGTRVGMVGLGLGAVNAGLGWVFD